MCTFFKVGFNLVPLFKKCPDPFHSYHPQQHSQSDQPLFKFYRDESKCGGRPTFIYFKCGYIGFKN